MDFAVRQVEEKASAKVQTELNSLNCILTTFKLDGGRSEKRVKCAQTAL